MSRNDINGGLSTSCDSGFQTLAFPFVKNGFKHELVERSGLICLVRRSNAAYPERVAHFEVVKLRRTKAFTWPSGATSPAQEAYPSDKHWGSLGWTYTTLEAARQKYDCLLQPTAGSSVPQKCDKPRSPAVKPAATLNVAIQARCKKRQAMARPQLELALAGGVL